MFDMTQLKGVYMVVNHDHFQFYATSQADEVFISQESG